jgi:hypothetical protein
MMVTSTLVSELKAVRERLSAKKAPILSECESQVAGINEVLAAIDKILSHPVTPPMAALIPDAHAVAPAVEGEPVAIDVSAEPAPPVVDLVPITTEAVEPPSTKRVARGPNWKRELAGLEQRRAIIRIAEIWGGTIQFVDVSHVFLDAGITKTKPKDVKGQIHRLIKESGQFEAIEPGTYRLRVQTEPPAQPPRARG